MVSSSQLKWFESDNVNATVLAMFYVWLTITIPIKKTA